jgi:hypothetical protein
MEHIEDCTGQSWMDAFGRQLHVSEFVVYGVFMDDVLGDVAPFGGPLCHNYYERTPLSPADARAFAGRMPFEALGAMISSHSHTPPDVRWDAFRRCAEVLDGRLGDGVRDPGRESSAWRPFSSRGCFDIAMLVAHVTAIAPAV